MEVIASLPCYLEHNVDSQRGEGVSWEGYVYDFDFNQMLGLPLQLAGKARVRISDLMDAALDGNRITVADHCYGCTAGQGSSCAGALGSEPKALDRVSDWRQIA